MKKVSTYLVLVGLLFLQPISSKAQQWFVKNFDFSTAINQKPDFRTSGTHVTTDVNEQATGVLVYGTIGYSVNELSGGDGGLGNSDGVILYNTVDGNNIWGITVGSSGDDVISRVVQDSEGHIAVTGYTIVNGQKNIFLMRILLDQSSGNQPDRVDWSINYGVGFPHDLINVNAYGKLLDSEGYALCGKTNSGKSFVFFTELDGTPIWSKEYMPTSGSLEFRSIIQPKIKDIMVSSIAFYDNYLVVAGTNDNSGYLARLDMSSGNIVNDIKTTDLGPLCDDNNLPLGFASVTQWQDGDIVAFGNSSGTDLHLMAFSDASSFTPQWNRVHTNGWNGAITYAYDINATAFGYLGIVENNGTKMEAFEYDFDGNIKNRRSLENMTGPNTNWYIKRLPGFGGTAPYIDFDVECGKALHLSGSETINSVNPPANWAIDNVPHARIRLNTESCIEQTYALISEEFCDNFSIEGVGSYAGIVNTITPSDFPLLFNELAISPNLFCESSCPQSACTDPIVVIGGANQDFVVLDGDVGFPNYLWSNGFTSRAVTVSMKDDVDSYSLDQTDANGCVTTKWFFVVKGKRLNSTEEELRINEVSLYPNPTTGLLNIDIPMDGITVEIFDALGKLVKKTDNLNVGTHQIDISEQAQGLFSVRVSGNGINKVIKLNKN